MYCNKCGKPLPDNSKFCPYCGNANPLGGAPNTDFGEGQKKPAKSKIYAGEKIVMYVTGVICLIIVVAVLFRLFAAHKINPDATLSNNTYAADTLGINLLDTSLTYRAYDYPATHNPLTAFSVMKPGIIMLPLQGGVYMPNFGSWYLQPDKDPLFSVSADLTDSTLYYSKNSGGISYILHAYKDDNTTQVVITDTFIQGFYNVISTGNESYYVSGLNAKGYHIWQREKDNLTLLFETSKPITAFTAINREACLICYQNNLVLLKKGESPMPLAAINQPADGIAVDSKGNIYVSAGNVIYQLISETQFKPVLTGIHGVLHYLDGKLYVLWQEKSKVIVVDFYSENTTTTTAQVVDEKPSVNNSPKVGKFTASNKLPSDTFCCARQLLVAKKYYSHNNKVYLVFQHDGNLVLYDREDTPLWASQTNGKPCETCVMQADGNLVLYDNNGAALWATGTHNNPSAKLVIQSDFNVVIYTADGTAIWSTQTNR